VGFGYVGGKVKSFDQWLIENNLANTGQTMEEIASTVMAELNIVEITKSILQNKVVAHGRYYDPMLYRQYKKYVDFEERNEKELRSIRNAIEIIKKLFAENVELRKRLDD
jgi:hypothetical protein